YRDIQTTILAGTGEVQIHLRGRAKSLELAKGKVDRLADELEDALEPHLFSSAGESLEQIVGYYLDMRGVTIATAESCTGGLGVGVTGVAGPGGGSEEKPVGLVYHALADGKKTEVVQRNFPGDRERIRWFASQQALDMVRRKLSE